LVNPALLPALFIVLPAEALQSIRRHFYPPQSETNRIRSGALTCGTSSAERERSTQPERKIASGVGNKD
jgi:hypothetical protein